MMGNKIIKLPLAIVMINWTPILNYGQYQLVTMVVSVGLRHLSVVWSRWSCLSIRWRLSSHLNVDQKTNDKGNEKWHQVPFCKRKEKQMWFFLLHVLTTQIMTNKIIQSWKSHCYRLSNLPLLLNKYTVSNWCYLVSVSFCYLCYLHTVSISGIEFQCPIKHDQI